ncbi:MAG: ATP-dependent DNA helicase RecG [Acidobacteriaceae bacterium]
MSATTSKTQISRLGPGADVQYIKGVGPRNAQLLAEKGIHCIEDLLYHLPFRYEDRANPKSIAELQAGEMASVIGEVRGSMLLRTRSKPIFELTLGSGRASIKCLWFNGTYLQGRYKAGQTIAAFGKVEADPRTGKLKLLQPQVEILAEPDQAFDGDYAERQIEASVEMGRIVPIYESAGNQKLSSRWFRGLLWRTLESIEKPLPDPLPTVVRDRLRLLSRTESFERVHFPPAETSMVQLVSSSTPAHFRLIFEELFFLELGLELKRLRLRSRTGISFALNTKVREAIKKFLPFRPTAAQKKVLAEIAHDMQSAAPMRRLLQGDVGSGKTLVALEAAVIAIENGYQVAFMAPTEILATQHLLSARRLLEPLGYKIVMLTGSLDVDQKRATRRHIAQGNAQLVVGTHALIEDKVEFNRVGLVIVDEQHRFGVMQRFRLMKKEGDAEPDTLVMTATPIPRTLALTLYGDLETSVLDELPPGRTTISTCRLDESRSDEVWAFIRKQAALAHQTYIVYPVIEGSKGDQEELTLGSEAGRPQKTPLKAAVKMYDELRLGPLKGLRVGLLHGRLNADEKEVVMAQFKRGDIDVLVSTTVIEVGVDVPNATVMVIEHAERFGLSQLHQLRGRIGRGAAESHCFLVTSGKVTEEGERRLEAMVRTQNGFEIAELDLELRGPGEFFGTRQAGMPELRVANIVRDRKIVELAKREAEAFVANSDGSITELERKLVMDHLRSHWQRRYGLVEVG